MTGRQRMLHTRPAIGFRESAPGAVWQATPVTAFRSSVREDRLILCRNCGNSVTSADLMITIRGQHSHTFTNPAGIVYTIGCFSKADGCMVHGMPTTEFSWFEGFGWSIALCGACLIHLGWFYQSGSEAFFGMILDRLIESVPTH